MMMNGLFLGKLIMMNDEPLLPKWKKRYSKPPGKAMKILDLVLLVVLYLVTFGLFVMFQHTDSTLKDGD